MSILLKVYNWIKVHLLKIDPRSQLEIAIDNGLKIGKNCAIMGEVILDPGHCWLIEIGDNVTIAPRAHILAHDASTKRELGYTKIGLVKIGNNVFIGAGSIILPNTHIGNNVVIGAGSVVPKDIPDNSVAIGNPARVIMSYDEYMEKNKKIMQNVRLFGYEYQIGNISEEQKREMIKELEYEIGFVV